MANIALSLEQKVWRKSMHVAMQVFESSQRFPTEERRSLTDPVRRSSRSVPAKISEAWRKRRYPAAFAVSKPNDAQGEAAEARTHLGIALRCRHLPETQAKAMDQAHEEILALPTEMADHPEQWTLRP